MRTVGEQLKEKRLEKGVTLVEVEQKIRVREKFLHAIEENDWTQFTSKIYIIGIIKTYSKFLGLDSKKMIAFFRRDYERVEEVKFKRRVRSDYLTPQTKKVAIILIIFIVILFGGYFVYQLKVFLSPPMVSILAPKETVYVHEDKIHVIGKTEKDAAVTIFGDRIYQDKDGLFEYDYPLHDGKNELVVEVVGANGKRTILKKDFTKEESGF